MPISRHLLIKYHLILGSFLLPVIFMFAITGTLYTFKITGQYNIETKTLQVHAPLEPNLTSMTVLAEELLRENNLPPPTGSAGIKKAGTSWQYEWTGSKMDLIIDPTANPLEAKVSFKHTTWHRYFVQLHKAKGGLAFKLLAAVLGSGLVLLLLSGWLLSQASAEMRRLQLVATLSGLAAFVLASFLS